MFGPSDADGRERVKSIILRSGGKVVLWEWNEASSRPIIMLHGFRGDHEGLTGVARHLQGFHLILPDLPGCGDSEPLFSATTVHPYVAWLDELVEALDLTHPVIWGHSSGAALALAHAALGVKPAKTVVAVAPAPIDRSALDRIANLYYSAGRLMPPNIRKHWIVNVSIERTTSSLLLKTPDRDQKKALMERGRQKLREIRPQIAMQQFSMLYELGLQNYASAIKCPVLLIAGGRDIISSPRKLSRLARLIPNGHTVVMNRQGHMAPLEDPKLTAAVTSMFLEKLHD